MAGFSDFFFFVSQGWLDITNLAASLENKFILSFPINLTRALEDVDG